jgi:FtsH-binding integral membrane protein
MLYLGVLWLGTIVFATSIVLDVVNIKEKNMLENTSIPDHIIIDVLPEEFETKVSV